MADCPECEEGLPEWIMSYADMITILMAFFVVMYSMAPTGHATERQEAVMKSLREQFGPHWHGVTALGPGPYVERDSPLAKLQTAGSREKGNSKKGVGSKKLRPIENRQPASLRPGDSPSVGGTIYFDDNSSQLAPSQEKALRGALREIGGKALKIEVRGHTSRRVLNSTGPLRDNWDLAYERARTVMKWLVANGIDPDRIRLSVSADNEPLHNNVHESARGKSSRVEIFMLNELVDTAQPEISEHSSSMPSVR
jgi:chemotaxis protein MotB